MRKGPTVMVGPFPIHVVSGGVLLSHTVSRAVPSALEGLTSGFGMGPGVSPPPKPPKRITPPPSRARKSLVPEPQRLPSSLITAPPAAPRLGSRLFSGNRTGTRTSRSDRHLVCVEVTRPISTGQLHTLRCFHFRPINPVICWGPYPPHGGGRSHLEEGFPLRCFQRLSRPNVANQPCHWHDNWHTRGPSVPVLSY